MESNEENIPKKKSVLILVILSYITLGIYPYFWYIKRSSELNNLQTISKLKKQIPIIALIINLVILIIGITMLILIKLNPSRYSESTTVLSQIPIEIILLSVIGNLFIIILIILIFFMAFRTRKILNQTLVNKGETIKLSGFYTFFFHFLYLQYEINRIIDDKENNKRRGPLIWFIILYILPAIISLTLLILFIAGISFLAQLNINP